MIYTVLKKNQLRKMKNLKDTLLIEQISNTLSEFVDSILFSSINNNGVSFPKIFDESLYEGLIKSYGHEMLIKKLCKTFCDNDEQFDYLKEIEIINSNNSNNSLKLTFRPDFFKGKLSDLESPYEVGPLNEILNLYGFYISSKKDNTLYVEPRFSEDLTNKIYEYNYIYHVTEYERLQKILKTGLNPKNSTKGSRKYSKRIYFSYGNIDDVVKQSKQIAKDRKLVKPLLLQIKLNKNSKHTFYIDPNIGEGAIYTYDCIHPKDISILEDVIF